MSERYRKVYERTTTDPWYRSLPSDSHRLLWMHILVCREHRDWGLFRFDIRDAERAVTGLEQPIETVLALFQEQRRLCFDNTADMVWLPKAMSFETLVKNVNVAKGIVTQIRPYEDHWSVGLLLASAHQYETKLYHELRHHCNDLTNLQPVPETVAKLFPEQVQRVNEIAPGLFRPTEHLTLNPEIGGVDSGVGNTSVVGDRVLDGEIGPSHWHAEDGLAS